MYITNYLKRSSFCQFVVRSLKKMCC
uniref:Uncharacterized protein n=1 Tax=Rhizophora mucronata TaxID=61149 RepID=A0A2P2QNG4_RHIMU